MQLEAADCGAACLGAVLAYFGCWVPLEELRKKCSVGRDGSTLKDIAQAARNYGLKATGWSVRKNELQSLPMPMILHWKFQHFVVLEGVGRGCYFLNDPAEGHRTIDIKTFNQDFTGVCLLLEPSPQFSPTGRRPGVARRLWPWLKVDSSLLFRAAFYGLFLTLSSLILPVLLSLFIDNVLVRQRVEMSALLIVAMVLAGGLTCLFTWLQVRSLRELILRVSIRQSDRFLEHLFSLPIHFFSHRYAGDLAQRMRQIDQMAEVGAGQLVRLLINLLMSLVFLITMLAFDVVLGILVACLGIGCAFLIHLLTGLRRDLNHQLRREQGLLTGTSASGLRMIETLQATARERDFFSRWSGRQARELVARQKFVELGHVAAAFPLLFQILVAAAVFGLGGWRTMNGDMSIGSLLGVYVLASNFLHPVASIGQFSDLLSTLEADFARMDDVLNTPQEPVFAARDGPRLEHKVRVLDGRLRLIGRFELRNVTFGFQKNLSPLIDNFSLIIEPGQRVAVVGLSGSGKSTLALLAAGLYQPWSGEILYDNYPLSTIPREVFCRSVSIVNQHPVLFATSIRNNLTMWNTALPEKYLTEAARDAEIHEEIISRPEGYDSAVEEAGSNFSGGQRARLEIARALANNPSLLILDEATSAVDPATELLIDDGIRRRGCACLIVAHRLSTIRDADWIVVIDQGRIIEQGTHKDLYNSKSFYCELHDEK